MKVDIKENYQLNSFITKFNSRKLLWSSIEEYKEKSSEWINNSLNTLNFEEIE